MASYSRGMEGGGERGSSGDVGRRHHLIDQIEVRSILIPTSLPESPFTAENWTQMRPSPALAWTAAHEAAVETCRKGGGE